MSLAAGARLGPYQVLGSIGAGGMGEVYKARDTRLDRTVAIKVLLDHVSGDPDRRARFEREARSIAGLTHPNICTLHDVGEHAGSMFLVMELLDGETLADRLEKGPLPIEQALTVATAIADSLSAAHRHGVIHRDLKPSNVMLTKSGAKLLDFGLAKLAAHGDQAAISFPSATRSAPLTGEGAIVGTLQYMAPEQLEGKPTDARTDLGVRCGRVRNVDGETSVRGDECGQLDGCDSRTRPGLSLTLRLFQAQGAFEARVVSDMKQGGLAGSCFAAVADFQVLDLVEGGIRESRPFRPDEALTSYRRQIENLRNLAGKGLVQPALAPADIEAARAVGKPAAIFSVEGGDFLEGSVERLREAYAQGVRFLTLTHYRANEISRPMTAAGTDAGLSDAGRGIVLEMNRLGMLIDLAHMPEAAAREAITISRAPVMFSHTHVNSSEMQHPRFISRELAMEVAAGGSLIGAWPAGIGISDLAGYVDRIFWLVDLLGEDHVCMGTDMDANYRPVFDDYRKLPDMVGRMLTKGMDEATAAKVLGGNLRRVWGQAKA